MKFSDIFYGGNFQLKTIKGSAQTVNQLMESYHQTFSQYDIWEFGTYRGQSLQGILKWLTKHQIEINNFIGFDSLQGLPLETEDKLNNPNWTPNKFSVTHDLQISDSNSYINYLKREGKLIPPYDDKFQLVIGFYQNSLNKSLAKKITTKPLFINIDCDLYSSTKQVLEFIFSNQFYIPGKTIFRYDDWAHKKQEYKTGQSKAHQEMISKYNKNAILLLQHSLHSNPEATWWLITN